MTIEEQDYYIKQFYDLILINAPHYAEFQESDMLPKMDMSASERLVYRDIAFDVYEKLRQDGLLDKKDIYGIFWGLTQQGRQEAFRLKSIHEPKPKLSFPKRVKVFIIQHKKDVILTVGGILLTCLIGVILHHYGLM